MNSLEYAAMANQWPRKWYFVPVQGSVRQTIAIVCVSALLHGTLEKSVTREPRIATGMKTD